MQYGICAGLDQLATKPSKLGFYEIYVSDLVPKEDDAAFAPRAEAIRNAVAPVRAANCFIPGDLKTTGPDVDIEALDAYVQVALQRAGQVGIETIVFGSGGSRMVPEGFSMTEATDQLVASLTRWAPMAKAAGVTIVLEPLGPECNIGSGVDESAAIVRSVNHPSIRLLVDTFHMARIDDPIESIIRAGDLIHHVHVAEIEERSPVGTHDEDFSEYAKALKKIGYNGTISLECYWKDIGVQAAQSLERVDEIFG